MSVQHLSDEAVAAFADGVLSGLARERAIRHTKACAECRAAVAGQREAVWALRAAPSPSLPSGLLDRLRGLPETTPITALPTAVAPDGTTMFAVLAPAAALVPEQQRAHRGHRTRSVVGAAALLTTFGVIAAGSGGTSVSGHPSIAPHGAPPASGGVNAPAAFLDAPVRGR